MMSPKNYESRVILAVTTLGVVAGLLPRSSGVRCSVKQVVISVLHRLLPVGLVAAHASVYIFCLWIPGVYYDQKLSVTVTEALSEIYLCVCSLLIIFWMWKNSKELKSFATVWKGCVSPEVDSQEVSPSLTSKPGVTINQYFLWFIVLQVPFEGFLYSFWYLFTDMHNKSVLLQVGFTVLEVWATFILRYPQIMWLTFGTALQYQFAGLNRVIVKAAKGCSPEGSLSKTLLPSGRGMTVVDVTLSQRIESMSDLRERDDSPERSHRVPKQTQEHFTYEKARTNLMHVRKRHGQLRQTMKQVEKVISGPLLISSFYTFSMIIICLFHAMLLGPGAMKSLTCLLCFLGIIVLGIQGLVADSIRAESQKTSKLLLEVASAAIGSSVPSTAARKINIMALERLICEGLKTRVCGLFTLSRTNTLAVAGASSCYLLILLQFHLADLKNFGNDTS